MREIKFRAWDLEFERMIQHKECEINNYHPNAGYLVRTFFWMQYTGLKDKNRKPIYEEDIISDNSGSGLVEYSEQYGAFRVNYKDGTCKWFYDYMDSERPTIEVIGNIYENNKLLRRIIWTGLRR